MFLVKAETSTSKTQNGNGTIALVKNALFTATDAPCFLCALCHTIHGIGDYALKSWRNGREKAQEKQGQLPAFVHLFIATC
jgi:hypothetical protein